MAELSRSFACPFRNPAWPGRVLVGAGLEALPLLIFVPTVIKLIRSGGSFSVRQISLLALPTLIALACRWIQIGYLRRFARQVLENRPEGLPPWDRFGEDFIEGFKLWLVTVGLFLPAVGLTALLAMSLAAAGAPGLAWLPIAMVLPPAALLTVFFVPAALMGAIAQGDIIAAFDLRRVANHVGAALGPYLLAFLVALAALILAQFGLLLLCAGVFATRFIAHCITVHAFAAAYGNAVEATPAPGPPPLTPEL